MLRRPAVNMPHVHERADGRLHEHSGRFPHRVIANKDINLVFRFSLCLGRTDSVTSVIDDFKL